MTSHKLDSYSPEPLKILMVEDDEFFSDIILTKLKNEGYQIEIVHEGKQAVAAAQQIQPALILLDMTLPDTTGVAVLQELKSNEMLESIPVIVFSNNSKEEDVAAGLNAGAVKYLIKVHTEFKSLSDTIREVITKS